MSSLPYSDSKFEPPIGPPPPYKERNGASKTAGAMPVSMPHQLPWATLPSHVSPPLGLPPGSYGQPQQRQQLSFQAPMGPPPSHQQQQKPTQFQPPTGPPPSQQSPNPQVYLLPPPYQQVPSHNHPIAPSPHSHSPSQSRNSHHPALATAEPSFPPPTQLTFHGPSHPSLISTSTATISLGPTPHFYLQTSKRSKPHVILSRLPPSLFSNHNPSPIDPPIATATWSSISGSIMVQLWGSVEVRLVTDWNSLTGCKRVENAPCGWEGGGLRWEGDDGGLGHVLREGWGRVLARWVTCGNGGLDATNGHGHNGVGSRGSGLGGSGLLSPLGLDRQSLGLTSSSLGLSSSSNGGGGGFRASIGLGDPVLTIMGAPPGVRIDDDRWVEFVIATGVCVLKREEKDIKNVMDVLEHV